MTPNITEWSDAKLTKGIAELVYPHAHCAAHNDGESIFVTDCIQYGNGNSFAVDYCNNWNDLMPLIIKHDVYYPTGCKTKQREMVEALYTVMLAKSKSNKPKFRQGMIDPCDH